MQNTVCIILYAKKGEEYHGELLLNDILEIGGFALVALLGFMPLLVVHWADNRPVLRLPRVHLPWRLSFIKTSLLVCLADWTLSIRI